MVSCGANTIEWLLTKHKDHDTGGRVQEKTANIGDGGWSPVSAHEPVWRERSKGRAVVVDNVAARAARAGEGRDDAA